MMAHTDSAAKSGPVPASEPTFDGLEGLLQGATSFEDLKNDLLRVEADIGRTYGVRGRRSIISHLDSGKLEEDELVARWNELYSAFKQWCKHDPPKIVEDFRQTAEGREERPFCFWGLRIFLRRALIRRRVG